MKKVILKMCKNYLPIFLGLFCFFDAVYAVDGEELCNRITEQEAMHHKDFEHLEKELLLFLGDEEFRLAKHVVVSCGGSLYIASLWPIYVKLYTIGTEMEFCASVASESERRRRPIWFDDQFISSDEYCSDLDDSFEESDDGLYIGGDIVGPAFNPSLLLAGQDNDWSTRCDLITNPTQVETDGNCEAPPSDPEAWANEVPGGLGTLAGGFIGYRRGKIRYEWEYFYRHTGHKGPLSSVQLDHESEVLLEKKRDEISIDEIESDDIVSHNAAFNIYYDFDPVGKNWRPYIGFGAVLSRVSLDHFGRFTRNHNPNFIKTFENPLLKARLAGTTTVDNSNLVDTLLGYQVLAGIDYRLNDGFSVGFKGRWVDMGIFEDSAKYLQLRSHESSVGRGLDVVHRETTNGIRALGVNFNMKYQWRRRK